MAYATQTTVSVERTRAEIEALILRYGADNFASFAGRDKAMIAFEMQGRRILFRLPLPDRGDRRFTHVKVGGSGALRPRPPEAARKAWEQACRSRWRGLLLCIKAKLESVEANIETFEDAFLAHIMLPGGQTVGEHVHPRIAQAYDGGADVPLLPGPGARDG